MPDATPMIILATVLILALGSLGYLTLYRWRASRTPTKQDPPEVVKERWLRREAENAKRHPYAHNR
jgi:hypothetical protein